MKTIITIITVFILSVPIHAQEPLAFEKIIYANDATKDQLFVSIYDWFATTYNDSKEVIQMSDKEQGLIVGKAIVKYLNINQKMSYVCYNGSIDYTIKVYIRDNRYKVVIDNFIHAGNPSSSSFCDIGLIDNREIYMESGWGTKPKNNTWKHLQVFVEGYSIMLFDLLEKKTNEINVELASDDW